MKKILLISHNSLNYNSNNGRTLIEYLKQYNCETIAQLYLHSGKPNAEFCDNYYEITDFDIIKSIYSFKSPGRKFSLKKIKGEDEKTNIHEEKLYNEGSKKKAFYVYVRNVIWNLNTWFSRDLKQWLTEFNPDAIVFFGGDSVFSYRIVNKISKLLKIPVLGIFGDDYYLNNKLKTKSFFGKYNNYLFKKVFKKFLKSNKYICIDELMLEDYVKEIGGEGYCIYNSSNIVPFKTKTINRPIKLSYLGNISINRYKSLIDIANVIVQHDLPVEFNVYTAEKREWILNNILNINGLNYKGQVAYEEVPKIMEESDFIVHVEDFSKQSQEEVKYSFSTKIADSLACGRCLIAYGPQEIATMKYLRNNKCALVSNSYQELEEVLCHKIFDNYEIEQVLLNARKMALKNHNENENHNKLMNIIESL